MNAHKLLVELAVTHDSLLNTAESMHNVTKIVSCDVYASAAVRLLETSPGWQPVLVSDYESVHSHPDDEQDPGLGMKCVGSVESGRFMLHYDRTLSIDCLRMVLNVADATGHVTTLSRTVRLPNLQDS